jgi:hypothetical protein
MPGLPQIVDGLHGGSRQQTTFRDLCESFRATGGIARADDLARLLEDFQCGNFASLAKRIASHEILSFSWRGMHWVPMFQFDLRDLSLRPGPQQLLEACGTKPDGWALACWLTTESEDLAGERPLDGLELHLPGLCDLARRHWQPTLSGLPADGKRPAHPFPVQQESP